MTRFTLNPRVLTLIGVPGSLLAVLAGFFLFERENTSAQPIEYNHKAHIESAGLTCTDCHVLVETSASASLPRLETCAGCHSDGPMSSSPEERKLLEHITQGTEIAWRRVYVLPDHVSFSHRRHVKISNVKCEVCHGAVAELTQPVSSPFLPVTMENCMNCHRDNNVTNDCLSCHR